MSLRVFLNMSSKAPLAARRLFSSAGITRGPGGRASAGPSTVTVFGSTGQLGRYVVTELAKRGNTVVVPYRGDDMEWRHLKVAGDLGRVIPVPYSVRDMTSVKDALQYSDKAINLIGKFWETQHVFGPFTPNYTLYDVNVTAAETIAKACNDMGTDHLVHVSALAANEESGSEWARTKAYGEKSVRRIKGDATIVRLGQLFGQEDNWLNLFAYLCRTRVPGVGPFVVNGGSNKVQPLWAPDAGEAIAAAALGPSPHHSNSNTRIEALTAIAKAIATPASSPKLFLDAMISSKPLCFCNALLRDRPVLGPNILYPMLIFLARGHRRII